MPESFGNVHVESLMSGTPAVIARVGAQRLSIPDSLVRKIDPGRTEDAAQHVAQIVHSSERTSTDLRHFLINEYSLKRMLKGYEEAVLQCDLQAPATFSPRRTLRLDGEIRIPPWAAVLDSGYYHDYSGYCADTHFLSILPRISDGVSVRDLIEGDGVHLDKIQRWVDSGLIAVGLV
ncbi:hypothetical protein [Mycobacterium deserti]|uniref:Glycosyl transferase family 1 domain-containing protein n=1 Tax=Mycobacterium deserti TaxID=2978347 RepID=A0ABT2M728_9MYCO|nr:hypothetical protein [Mycobacterium deserti]MCT7658052.1 hypothetical protein [Mycobacterium deserti]